MAQHVAQQEGILVFADHDRYDRGLAGQASVHPALVRLPDKTRDVARHAVHDGGVLLQQADRFQRRRGQGRGNAHREHKAGQVIAQVVDDLPASGQVAAAGAQALG
ncbi:hypothetical protein SDC9_197567 [bioreactor metagenome]|uniref:Uncharacterized protein n=1 Tax=bioreactor metagenome TaxID=1076179 RepID=A0A645IRV2_9ZZZZ